MPPRHWVCNDPWKVGAALFVLVTEEEVGGFDLAAREFFATSILDLSGLISFLDWGEGAGCDWFPPFLAVSYWGGFVGGEGCVLGGG